MSELFRLRCRPYQDVLGLWFSEGGGASPLAVASFSSNESFIESLLAARAQTDLCNHRGQKPIDLARHASTRRCLELVAEEEMISMHF